MDTRREQQDVIRISDDPELVVHVTGGDGNRFADIFRQAFSALPEDVKALIQRHWSPIGPRSPEIRLENGSHLQTDSGTMAGMAMTDQIGKRLRFCGSAIDWLLAENRHALATSLVVHELGHVHSFAEWAARTISAEENDAYMRAIAGDSTGINDLERMVDDRMRRWGFDPDSLRQVNEEFLRRLEPIT